MLPMSFLTLQRIADFTAKKFHHSVRAHEPSGPGRLVAVAFSLLWLPRVMLHLLHQGPVVQSNCAVGSSYQSSMDHCRPLWSRSRCPIDPKKVLVQLVRKSWSPIYYSITVSCYHIYWLSNIFIFSAKREKNISPLQFQPLLTHSHLSFYLYPDLSYACPSFKTETKHS